MVEATNAPVAVRMGDAKRSRSPAFRHVYANFCLGHLGAFDLALTFAQTRTGGDGQVTHEEEVTVTTTRPSLRENSNRSFPEMDQERQSRIERMRRRHARLLLAAGVLFLVLTGVNIYRLATCTDPRTVGLHVSCRS